MCALEGLKIAASACAPGGLEQFRIGRFQDRLDQPFLETMRPGPLGPESGVEGMVGTVLDECSSSEGGLVGHYSAQGDSGGLDEVEEGAEGVEAFAGAKQELALQLAFVLQAVGGSQATEKGRQQSFLLLVQEDADAGEYGLLRLIEVGPALA